MPDREKVIKNLTDLENIMIARQEICPAEELQYWIELQESLADTIALLKEQEAVEPHYNARTNWYECGNCHYSMTSGMHCKSELIPAYKVGFCAKCGRKQEWE